MDDKSKRTCTRSLQYIMDKPTIYLSNSKSKKSEGTSEVIDAVYLSILKQCLKFGDEKDANATLARINIYKIA